MSQSLVYHPHTKSQMTELWAASLTNLCASQYLTTEADAVNPNNPGSPGLAADSVHSQIYGSILVPFPKFAMWPYFDTRPAVIKGEASGPTVSQAYLQNRKRARVLLSAIDSRLLVRKLNILGRLIENAYPRNRSLEVIPQYNTEVLDEISAKIESQAARGEKEPFQYSLFRIFSLIVEDIMGPGAAPEKKIAQFESLTDTFIKSIVIPPCTLR